MAFNASSPSLFDEISGLYLAVLQGFSQVTSDYNSFNKTKNFPEYNSANLLSPKLQMRLSINLPKFLGRHFLRILTRCSMVWLDHLLVEEVVV